MGCRRAAVATMLFVFSMWRERTGEGRAKEGREEETIEEESRKEGRKEGKG